MASGYWEVHLEVSGPAGWSADDAAALLLERLSMYRSLAIVAAPDRLMVTLHGGPTPAPDVLAEYVRTRVGQELESGGVSGCSVTVLDIVECGG